MYININGKEDVQGNFKDLSEISPLDMRTKALRYVSRLLPAKGYSYFKASHFALTSNNYDIYVLQGVIRDGQKLPDLTLKSGYQPPLRKCSYALGRRGTSFTLENGVITITNGDEVDYLIVYVVSSELTISFDSEGLHYIGTRTDENCADLKNQLCTNTLRLIPISGEAPFHYSFKFTTEDGFGIKNVNIVPNMQYSVMELTAFFDAINWPCNFVLYDEIVTVTVEDAKLQTVKLSIPLKIQLI